MGNTSSFVMNLKHFSDMVSTDTVDQNEVMVSLDVQSLFTSVPIEKSTGYNPQETGRGREQDNTHPEKITLLLGSACAQPTSFTTNSSMNKRMGQRWVLWSHGKHLYGVH